MLSEEVEGNSSIDKNATSYLQTRSIFSSSDMESHHDFSTKLFGLSEEEARRQDDREKLITLSEFYMEVGMYVQVQPQIYMGQIF